MEFLSELWSEIGEYFKRAWASIKHFFVSLFSFAKNVLDYFKSKLLNSQRHKPFIGDYNKILKQYIHQAPTKNVGIFRGVYDEVTDEIDNIESVEADSLDVETREIMGSDSLVVLS